MERTSEFLGFVAKAQLTSRQPEGTDARTTRDQFTEAARGITDGISRTNRITAALRAGAPSSADAREHEQMVVVFTARCVKELATLESRVSAGISSQQMLAHRKGVIAMLYEKLKNLMRSAKSASPQQRHQPLATSEPVTRMLFDPARLPAMHPNLMILVKTALRVDTGSSGGDRVITQAIAIRPADAPAVESITSTVSGSRDIRRRPDKAASATASSHDSRRGGVASANRVSGGDKAASSALRPEAGDGLPTGADRQQQSLLVQQPSRSTANESLQIEQQMHEVSTMVSLISEHLSSQQEDIQHVLEAAETSTALVNQGNAELSQAAERPDLLRYVSAVLLFGGAVLLLVYDWIHRQ